MTTASTPRIPIGTIVRRLDPAMRIPTGPMLTVISAAGVQVRLSDGEWEYHWNVTRDI